MLAYELVIDIVVDYTTEECRVPIPRTPESRTNLGEPLNIIQSLLHRRWWNYRSSSNELVGDFSDMTAIHGDI